MKQSAGAYLKQNYIYLHCQNETSEGIWILSEPIVKLDSLSSIEVIGLEVIRVLSFSKQNVPHPTNWNGFSKSLLSLANSKSYKSFSHKTQFVSIGAEIDIISFIPTCNDSSTTGGFSPLREATIQCNTTQPSLIGKTLLQAFDICK